MVGIKADQDAVVAFSYLLDLFDNFRCDAGALDHLDAGCHRMRLDGGAVVSTNVDVDTQYPAARFFGIEADARFNCFAHIQFGPALKR